MFKNIWFKILALFGKKQNIKDETILKNEQYDYEYKKKDDINFTAIFSNKLANYTISDSTIDISGDSIRATQMQEVLKRLKRKLKKIISTDLGTGGVLVVPYVANNKIYFNIVPQSRLLINKKIGEDIVDCTILAEKITINKENYYRWADYTIKNNTIYFRYRATKEDEPVNINSISVWKNIKDFSINNVSKMPFMYITSPIDSRRENDDYGVPITFGCDKQIKRLYSTLAQIDREFKNKDVFVGVDATMFKGDNALPTNGIYKKINAGDDSFWEIFDPAFRDTALYNKLMKECSLLEKMIGTSKGILTEIETNNATATEIKKMLKDTFDIVDDIRDSLEDGLRDFIDACNVLSNYYNLSPQGDCELLTDWAYDMIEDTSQTFNQLMQGRQEGVIKKVEVRQFLKPNETLEESLKAIEDIKAEEPTTKDLLGE